MNTIKTRYWHLMLFILLGWIISPTVNAKNPIPKNKKAADVITTMGDAFPFQMNGMVEDILSNDKINGTAVSYNNNVNVEQVGNWPTGIYINTAGKVVVVAGTVMPRVPLEYKVTSIADPSVSSTAKIIFYDVTNKFANHDFYIWNEVDSYCYTSNTNEVTATLHMVYIGSTPKTLASATSTGEKFRINTTGYNTVSTDWTYRTGFSYYQFLSNSVTLQPFEEITYKYKIASTSSSADIKLSAVRFGIMDDREVSAAPGEALDNFSTIRIYKLDSAPGNKNKSASLDHNITALNVSGLSASEANNYVFYDSNNNVIPATTVFPNNATGTYVFYYAKINGAGCIGAKSKLTLTVSSSSVNAGKINIDNISGLEEKNICAGSTVQIFNETHAGSTTTTTYSWEMSEDEGNTWQTLSSNPDNSANYSYTSDGLIKYSHIKVTSITKTVWLKRKTYNNLNHNQFNYSNIVKINVENNIISYPGDVKSYSAALNGSLAVPAITASIPGSSVKIYDNNNHEITGNIPTDTKGTFTYTVLATAPSSCVTTDQFEVQVYDIIDCSTKTKRIYASKSIPWTSGASKTFFADDSQVKTINDTTGTYLYNNAGYASLSGGVVLLGIGTVGIDLFFTKPDGTLYTPEELKGKKVTLKLGEQYSGVKVAGGLSVIGRKTTATTANNISIGLTGNTSSVGMTVGVKGGVLDLLKGDNVFTFSFTPKTIRGEDVAFNGIRVQLGSLLAVADLASVFYAYIEEEEIATPGLCAQEEIRVTPYLYHIDDDTKTPLYPETQSDIDGNTYNVENENIVLNNFAQDITWGNRTEVLNVASALSSVVHPYYAVDNDYNTYALFNSTVGVLNQQFLQVQLRQRAEPGDQVRLVLSYPNINLINLKLLQLGNFKLVYYLGDAEVGQDKLEQFRVLDIGLFNFGNHKRAVLTKPVKVPFDRIEIRQFQTINVNIGDGLHIYDVRIQPQMLFEGQIDPKQITTICAAQPLAIQKPSLCTEFEVSFAKIKQWGIQLSDEDGNPLFETGTTNPIKSILEIEDIPNTTLAFRNQTTNANGTFTDNFNLTQLYKQYENEGVLLLKIQAKRQGCPYGEPEYLKVRLKNCIGAVTNPTIRVLSK